MQWLGAPEKKPLLMSRRMEDRAPVLILALGLGVCAARCGSGGSAPTAPSPPPTTLFQLTVPALIAPAEGETIPQNNAATGCPFDSRHGYGNMVMYDWTDSLASAGVEGYELYVMNKNATIPLLDIMVPASAYVHRQCNAFVVDQFLEGWDWRVRVKDRSGEFSDWSPTRSFRFAPCRVNGKPCRS